MNKYEGDGVGANNPSKQAWKKVVSLVVSRGRTDESESTLDTLATKKKDEQGYF